MNNPFIVLIPAKNEALTVASVVREIIAHFCADVLVINDASTDNTAEEARQAGATVLTLVCSLGAWGATQTGLRYALQKKYRYAITMDADGQHQADSLPILAASLYDEKTDVVIGAYPQRGSPARRFAWWFFRQLAGISLEDLTSGLRAYNEKAIAVLASPQATLIDYQDMGVLLLLDRENIHIKEVEIAMQPRSVGHSRIFSSWWAVGHYMLQTIALCLARARCLPFSRCQRSKPL